MEESAPKKSKRSDKARVRSEKRRTDLIHRRPQAPRRAQELQLCLLRPLRHHKKRRNPPPLGRRHTHRRSRHGFELWSTSILLRSQVPTQIHQDVHASPDSYGFRDCRILCFCYVFAIRFCEDETSEAEQGTRWNFTI